MKQQIALAYIVNTPIGKVYVAPNGLAMATWRIGQRKAGILICTPNLSDREIAMAGLTGKVISGFAEAS